MTTDIFRPLDSAKREIRLLTILPGTWHEHIGLEVSTISLDVGPRYTALSYAWGSGDKCEMVSVEKRPLQVTRNVFDVLRRLRRRRENVTLWIDAICINQNNNAERSRQVSIMGQIYKNAVEVFIWLGDRLPAVETANDICVVDGPLEDGPQAVRSDDQDTAVCDWFANTEEEAVAAFSILRSLASGEHWDAKNLFSLDEQGQYVVGKSYLAAWDAFMRLMKCPWWSRMWVVQEFVLSRASQLIIGNVAVPGRLMTDFFTSYSTHLPPGSCCHLTVTWKMASSLWSEMIDIRRTVWSLNAVRNDYRRMDGDIAATRLRKTTWLLRHKNAADPRDKIFGVLGLVPDVGFHPDYTVDAAETFCRATEFLISSEKSLMALVGPRMRCSGMPSFVPDLIGGQEDRFFQNTVRRINLCRLFRAAEDLDLWFQRHKRTLSLRGRKVDIVKSVSACIPDGQEAEGLLRWEREADIASAEPYPDGISRTNAFWRTLIRDMIVSVQEPESVRRATPEDAQCYGVFHRWIFAIGHTDKSSIAAERADFEHFRKSFFVATQQEVFFTTGRGFMGTAMEVQQGDEVWILAGGTVPFLLRPHYSTTHASEIHTLVGDCYVHGMMDGQEVCGGADFKLVSLQ